MRYARVGIMDDRDTSGGQQTPHSRADGSVAPVGGGAASGAADPPEGPLSVACPTISDASALDPGRSHSVRAEAVARPAALPDFNTIYREQQGRVLAAVRTIIGPSDEIEDVVQLAFIEVHRSLPRFQGRSRLSTWIYRIAINVALQHLRKKKRKRWLMFGATGEEIEREAAPIDDNRRLEDRQLLQAVYRAADKLSEKKRTVWVLHELQGMEPTDIGDLLGIPMNTARSRLLAARREIKTELARLGVLSPDEGE